mmetsp:Transcript_15723/g.23819  ORF Transcript_15723/g.23819 Transcript_15723/m.23819 type:complete len:606 (-) Transcript_15723:107-1924(-)|eukprot:CAMPEP_0178913622 /NCGR_PEP_ID=MMETSP0786-20121207/10950_1 /TAXON_ID=186022 /ORGANISM="Thalassionema frauenfeldii, Strain CCMP 1798" /LENGTH=605 /DNA_ID=CAMNT_0020586395 /DNA_START=196 /DNA_END=2013 /DNA_ORIENTATION=-
MDLSSPSPVSLSIAIEEPLLTTIADNMRIRSEVEETMNSLLTDVEIASSLETALQWEEERKYLTKRAIVHEMAWKEMKMVQDDDACKSAKLADELVKELHQVSQELGRLRRWKKSATEERELERKQWEEQLKQAEEQILTLFKQKQQHEQKIPPKGDMNENPQLSSASKENDTSPSSEIPQHTITEERAIPKEEMAEGKESETVKIDDANNDSETKQQRQEEQSTKFFPNVDIPSVDSVVDSNDAAAATLELDDDQPRLETFEESLLLNIFAYMDALEIVQLAQVNIALYSRVDSLFGISEQSSSNDAPPPKEIQTTSTPPQGTIITLPPDKEASATTATKVKATEEKKPSSNSGGIISLFQTNRPKEAPPSQTINASAAASASSTKPPLSAAMANSMAEKLTDTEINAIISMTEKLNKRNKEVEALSKENTNLKGALEGTEAVKGFLVQKVRDLETSLTKNQEVEIKTAQQIASDQEVIAFLDNRVQVLEKCERTLELEAKTAREDLVRSKVQSDSKITVLSDMLRYERERLAENESDWKATKKVLVKEVKLCRAQIMALQAERNGLAEQVEQLQKAVLPLGSGTGMPASIVLNSPLSSPAGPQ